MSPFRASAALTERWEHFGFSVDGGQVLATNGLLHASLAALLAGL